MKREKNTLIKTIHILWNASIIRPLTLIFCAFFQPSTLKERVATWNGKSKVGRLDTLGIIITIFLNIFLFSLLLTLGQFVTHRLALNPLVGNFIGIILIATGSIIGGLIANTISFSSKSDIILTFGASILFAAGISITFANGASSIISATIIGILVTNYLPKLDVRDDSMLTPITNYLSEFNIRADSILQSDIVVFCSLLIFLIILSIPFSYNSITTQFIFLAGYLLGRYRLPLYLVDTASALGTFLASRKQPTKVFMYLRHSALHWDETLSLTLPYLQETFFIAAEQDVNETLQEILFIISKTPSQVRAISLIFPKIILSDLNERKTLQEIADASQYLSDILSQSIGLLDQQWRHRIIYLRDASLDAGRARSRVSLRTRRNALEALKIKLQKIPTIAEDTEGILNDHLNTIVTKWTKLAQQELMILEMLPKEFGHIENPYNTGRALKSGDTLFVGRENLVRQLEQALSREDTQTFMLNGERRLGKTSVLHQLSRMLDPRYLHVSFDLQQRGITSSAVSFLETIRSGIEKVVKARGIKIEALNSNSFYKASKSNEAALYFTFDKWLQRLEETLERERYMLLLTFDEFEKLVDAGKAQYIDLPLLLDWFRSVMQNYSRFALLFSGVHTLEEMSNMSGVSWAHYFVNVQTLRVSFLQPEEARQLITQPRPNFPSEKIFNDDVVSKIIYKTACHPFLVQAVCTKLIDHINIERHDYASESDVTIAIEQVLEGWRDTYFSDMWERTDSEQQACLRILNTLAQADIHFIVEQSHLAETKVQQAMQRLLNRDLILRNNDTYQISTPIFSEWIEQKRYK